MENRPPNGPAENHESFSERRDEHRKQDNAAAKSEEAEGEDGESRSEQHRPGTKRILRNRRKSDIPKPPRVPDWFLKHNVKLVKDSPGMSVSEDAGQIIKCVDAETGHTLFEVPYYDAWPSSTNGGTKGRKASLQKDFFDHRIRFEDTKGKDEAVEFKMQGPEGADEWTRDQLRWAFLEAETSARAAFSLPPPNQRSYSVLSNRVDLSLQCPDENSHDQMDEFVRDLARIVQADVVRLDANDFAELSEEYIDMGHDGPGSYSHLGYDVFQNYQAASLSTRNPSALNAFEPEEENDMDEDEEDEEERDYDSGRSNGLPFAVDNIRQALMGRASDLGKLGHKIVGVGIHIPRMGQSTPWSPSSGRSSNRVFQEANQDDNPRLVALLESLVDSPLYKLSSGIAADVARRAEKRKSGTQKSSNADGDQGHDYQRTLRYYRANPARWLPQVAKSLVSYLNGASQAPNTTKPNFKLMSNPPQRRVTQFSDASSRRRTIIHVRDLRDISNSRIGESIVQALCRVVQKRRQAGEHIMVIGTTAQDTLGPFHLPGDNSHMHEFPLRSITIPPFFKLSFNEMQKVEAGSPSIDTGSLDNPAHRRIMEINIRHLQTMLRKLRPEDSVELSAETHDQINLPGMRFLTERVLSADQIQRLALIAIGLSQTHAKSGTVQPMHLALASFVTTRSDLAVKAWTDFNEKKRTDRMRIGLGKQESKETSEEKSGEARVEQIKKSCNAHETRLLSGVVDPGNIKTTFSEVHAQPETINALKDLTTLSLLRPEAFKYGVLASDRLPGLLLYGPPGTGKTLLAKAVARESKATVLEVSGAQIYEKYVGEGEKMVRAVFSLAKKLSPCVVFIDEADAIFGSRSNSGGNRTTHREIINQFLREWDGMDDHSVFMMVASNRPFDLDDAVLRRLPRRLLVDLPVAKDRESILGIHLKEESLDPAVSLADLAEQTPFYSGSDLKNLSVAAALACVREENELVSQHKDDREFKLPQKRVLQPRHFEKALAEISASISEDMSSLAAIRKFDEQYGDRKGRRKKTNYGFGLGDGGVDESAVRVRSAQSPPPP